MPRYKLTIEYDGTPFVGWQAQARGLSVQGLLSAAIAAFCGEDVSVHGAGRTDAGVHALGQVAQIDLARAMAATSSASGKNETSSAISTHAASSRQGENLTSNITGSIVIGDP